MKDIPETTAPARPAGNASQLASLSLSIDPSSMARFLDLLREVIEPMIAKALSQVQSATSPPPQAAETPNTSAAGVDLKPTDRIKAADLRVALLMGKIPED